MVALRDVIHVASGQTYFILARLVQTTLGHQLSAFILRPSPPTRHDLSCAVLKHYQQSAFYRRINTTTWFRKIDESYSTAQTCLPYINRLSVAIATHCANRCTHFSLDRVYFHEHSLWRLLLSCFFTRASSKPTIFIDFQCLCVCVSSSCTLTQLRLKYTFQINCKSCIAHIRSTRPKKMEHERWKLRCR